MLQVPWDRSARFAMPVDVWRRMIAAHYPFRSWMPLDRDTLERLMRRKAERGLPTFDACVAELLDGRRGLMDEQLERLVSSLLYEGYALYPYTPGRDQERDADPVRDRLSPRLREPERQHLRPPAGAVRAGRRARDRRQRHRALPAGGGRASPCDRAPARDSRRAAGAPARRRGRTEFRFEGEPAVCGRIKLRADETEHEGLFRISMCVHNATELGSDPAEAERADALRASLLSTHVVLEASRGRFASPLERDGPEGAAVAACESVNTFPVLASPDDDAVLGGRDRAPRPPQDGAGEPRQPVRQHRDRGGPAAPRPGAVGRRARGDRGAGPGGARDGRARERDHARRRSWRSTDGSRRSSRSQAIPTPARTR